jgi:hypothetical protein
MPPIQSKFIVFHSQSHVLVSVVYKFMKGEASTGTPINHKAIQKE